MFLVLLTPLQSRAFPTVPSRNSNCLARLTRYALALKMFRRLPLLIVAVALLITIEPLVHSHPLWESDARAAASSAACAVCAAGTTQLPTIAPTVVAPVVVVSIVAAQPVSQQSAAVALSLPSRAPPAASRRVSPAVRNKEETHGPSRSSRAFSDRFFRRSAALRADSGRSHHPAREATRLAHAGSHADPPGDQSAQRHARGRGGARSRAGARI